MTEREYKLQPLDFIEVQGTVGLVTEISKVNIDFDNFVIKASVEWIGENPKRLHSAWWSETEVTVIDSLPRLLTRELAHPFGNGKKFKEIFNLK